MDTHRTVGTWTRRLLLGLAGLYVTWGVIGTLAVVGAAGSAKQDAEDRARTAEHWADQAREDARRSLRQVPAEARPSEGRDPRPVGAASYSWREVSCEIRSVDSGWIAVDFEQVCAMRDVDLYPTRASLGGCQRLTAGWFSHDDRRPEGWETPVTSSAYRATGQQLQSDSGDALSCPTGLLAPRDPGESALLSGRRPDELPPDSSWVVVTRTDQFSRTRLGCNPWIPAFCTSPLPAPWTPDL